MPDITNLGLVQFAVLLLLVAVIDFAGGVAAAVATGTFTIGDIARVVSTHVLNRVFPIFGLAVLGHGVPALGVPAIEAASLASAAGLVLYVTETVASLKGSFDESRDARTPSTDTP